METLVLDLDYYISVRPWQWYATGIARYLACGIGWNLDRDGVKTTTGGFNIALTAMSHLYFMLSCQPTSSKALEALCACRVDNRVSGILAGPRPVKVRSLRRLGLGCLVGLEAYECHPCGDTGPKCLQGPDPREVLACDRHGSPHLRVIFIEAKLGEEHGTWLFTKLVQSWGLDWVSWIPGNIDMYSNVTD
jgi:hypothetical protein